MRALHRFILCLLVALPALAQVRTHTEIKTPPLRKMNVPQPKRIALGNGAVIFLLQDRELPLIRGRVTIRGGERDVPAEKAGLNNIYGQAWRTGGTQSKSGDELDEFLEARAARVETFGDEDSTAISFDMLKEDLDAVFPIFIDLLRNPAFRQEKIDLAKTQARTVISRRNDEPGAIVGREATKLGYGPNTPYAHQPEYATIAAITREDLLAHHKRFAHPNNMIIGVSGDFDLAQMERRLRQAFGSLPRGPQAPPPPTTMNPARPGLYFIAKSDVTQANIAMVHPGIQRNNPDYYAVQIMNEIFSNGFSGRLMQRLRSQRGLTYGVGGGLGAPWDHPGLFRVQMATKSGTTLESIDALRKEVAGLTTEPFTSEELALAKESVLNAFIFTMDTPAKVLNQAMLLEFHGFPADYFQKYPANIEKVTAADVARVAKKYVDPDKLAVLVVGNEKDFEKPLSSLGQVTSVDITIPEGDAKPRPAAAAPAGNAEGAALVARIQQFVGGKANLDKLTAVRSVATGSRKGPQGTMDVEIDSLTVFPDHQRAVMKMPMGEMTMVMTPDTAFAVLPGMGVRDLPGSQRDMMRAEAKQELIHVLKNAGEYAFAAAGSEKIGDVSATLLEVTSGGQSMKLYVDPVTGRVLRKVAKARGPMAEGDQVTEYIEWKNYGGVNFPIAWNVIVNGEQVGSGKITSVEVNPAIDPKVWEKPGA
jgi:zinc protease